MGKKKPSELSVNTTRLMGCISGLMTDIKDSEVDGDDELLSEQGVALVRYLVGTAGVHLLGDTPTLRESLAMVMGALIYLHRSGTITPELLDAIQQRVSDIQALADV